MSAHKHTAINNIIKQYLPAGIDTAGSVGRISMSQFPWQLNKLRPLKKKKMDVRIIPLSCLRTDLS